MLRSDHRELRNSYDVKIMWVVAVVVGVCVEGKHQEQLLFLEICKSRANSTIVHPKVVVQQPVLPSCGGGGGGFAWDSSGVMTFRDLES